MKRIILASLVLLCGILASQGAPAQSNFSIPADTARRYASNIRSAPVYIDVRQLAATVAETHTLPAGTKFVIFSADCNFYARPGASAALPAGDVTNGTGSELNPAAWYFANAATATQQITVIAATACNITLSAYAGPLM